MTNTTLHLAQTVQSLLNNNVYTKLMEFLSISWMSISVLGIIGNIINIKTFTSAKLEDGMSIAFLVLSFSDLGFLVIMFGVGTSSIFYVIEVQSEYHRWFQVEPYGTTLILTNTGIMFYVLTELTTTYVSLARCMCVTRPLHFKNTFTRRTTLVCTLTFATFGLATSIPVVVNMGFKEGFDIRVNTSRTTLWLSPNREAIKRGVWGLTDIFLPFTTQIIVLICLIVMANKLRNSLKFRQAFKTSDAENKLSDTNTRDAKTQQSSKVDRKDTNIIKQVMLLSAVYIVCNTPKIIINITALLVDDFTLGRRYQNLYLILNSVRVLCETVNSSASLPIYYTYNGKFRILRRK
ncbi:unnamed protein product [Candidula unifasciata]|uniref:G-protein coupled receptors family 1 profile domain-containing protein n=1 Tax=Candidula unifasciata TaxID=100452 RepID=A0A8S3Z5C9_9EUPU|nr:unnamed protein product [Candidula unifasciata]